MLRKQKSCSKTFSNSRAHVQKQLSSVQAIKIQIKQRKKEMSGFVVVDVDPFDVPRNSVAIFGSFQSQRLKIE
jgi:hypothetical protein